jgi:hypothetical protein
MLPVLLACDDPRTSWFFHRCHAGIHRIMTQHHSYTSGKHAFPMLNHKLAMCAVVVSKTSCKDRNHPILRGSSHHTIFFFCKNHDFSRFLINFWTVVVVKQTHVVDPKRLTHSHSHRDLNSLSLSTESTYLLVPMP